MKKIFTILLISTGLVLTAGVGTIGALSATGNLALTNPNKKYTCKFFNYDDTLLYTARVEPSHNVTYKGKTPVRPKDDMYFYEFSGWDKELSSIRQDTDFKAQFIKNHRDFHVRFINYDNTVLYETDVQSGSSVYYPFENPTRPSDDRYGYRFIGWDEDTSYVITDTTFVAQYERSNIKYKVYFYDYDEKLLYTDQVFYGGNATYLGPDLVGPSCDVGYHYEFDSWSGPINDITENTSVIASYRLEQDKFAVSYYNWDGENLYTDEVFYGESSVYLGQKPHRPSDNVHSYNFVGWDKDTRIVTEDMSVYALYEESDPDCIVTFKNWDYEVLETHTVHFGESVEYEGEEPTRPDDDKYTYTFIGWDRELDIVNKSFDTVAQYEKTLKTFTITYLNYDEEILYEAEIEYGGDATDLYEGDAPTKPNDGVYYFTFRCWDEDLTNVTKDITTMALFDAHPLTPVDGGTSGSGGSGGGSGGVGPGEGGGGGGDPIPLPPGKKAKITFLNWDSELLCYDEVPINKGLSAHYEDKRPDETITRPDDRKHTNYVFCSFDKPLTDVKESFTTYAQYVIKEDAFDKYIVTFRDADGALLYECVCEENEMPTFPSGITPGANNDYIVFVGWDKPLIRATESYTVYAKYKKTTSGGGGGGPSKPDGDGDGDGDGKEPSETGGDIGFPDPDAEEKTLFTINSPTYSGVTYLREHSFGNISGSSWKKIDAYDEAKYSPLFYTADKLGQVSRYQKYEMNVTYTDYRLFPVVPNYSTNTNYVMNGDISQFKASSMEFTYNYVPAEFTVGMYNLLNMKSYTSSAYTTEEVAYREYVHDTYLDLNSNHQVFFDQFIEDHHLSVETAADIINVKNIIQKSASYNLNGTPCPAGKDPIIYFLSESHEGVCNHFASALVLTYRALGLPARYVTGYYISKLVWDDVTGKYVANVTTKTGHAWTEVYLDGIGWVALDATPGDTPKPTNPYNPFGKLEVEPPLLTITVEPLTNTKVYDGEPMVVNASYDGEFLNEGDYIAYNICDEEENVGYHTARCRPRIYNANDIDVTDSYVGMVKMIFKTYTITQKLITVETGSASKEFDGTELVKHTFTITDGSLVDGHQLIIEQYTGTQTKIGTSDNTVGSYKIIDTATGEDVTKNYSIVWHYGTLTVNLS